MSKSPSDSPYHWNSLLDDCRVKFRPTRREEWLQHLEQLQNSSELTAEGAIIRLLARQWHSRLQEETRPPKIAIRVQPEVTVRSQEAEACWVTVWNRGEGTAFSLQLVLRLDDQEVWRSDDFGLPPGRMKVVRRFSLRAAGDSEQMEISVECGDTGEEIRASLPLPQAKGARLEDPGFVNPYRIVDGPLGPDDPYVGKKRDDILMEIEERIREGPGGEVFSIWGFRRVGKTSLIYRLRYDTQSSDEPLPCVPVYKNCLFLERREPWTYEEFFGRTARDIRGELLLHGIDIPPDDLPTPIDELSVQDFEEFVKLALRAAEREDKKILLIFDDADVFSQSLPSGEGSLFRDQDIRRILETFFALTEMPDSNLFIMFAIGREVGRVRPLNHARVSARYCRRVPLLERDDLEELLLWGDPPFEYSYLAKEYLWAMTGGHPSLAQLICGEVARQWTEDPERCKTADLPMLQQVTGNLVRNADLTEYFRYLLEYSLSEAASAAFEKLVRGDFIDYRNCHIPSKTLSELEWGELETPQIVARENEEFFLRVGLFARWLEIWSVSET